MIPPQTQEKNMRTIAIMMVLALAGCATAAPDVEPIPGSITYGGQPRTKLTKSPIGSTLSNEFVMGDGRLAIETYRVQPDRSLKLERREIVGDWPQD
ncbi:hypothetical protein AGRO_1914 [Agrobacterium sp. ATCC 31749]|jgi:hypothetical protein|nr:hypothetical protein AGRO_1914 [Agrobacterium sp. ATCC 31749]